MALRNNLHIELMKIPKRIRNMTMREYKQQKSNHSRTLGTVGRSSKKRLRTRTTHKKRKTTYDPRLPETPANPSKGGPRFTLALANGTEVFLDSPTTQQNLSDEARKAAVLKLETLKEQLSSVLNQLQNPQAVGDLLG